MLWLSWSGHSLGMLTNNTLDFSGRRTKDATQQEAHIPLEFLLFFLLGGLSNATFLFFIFYCYIQITNYYDPQGDAFQTKTKVMHCIAPCFYRRVEVQGVLYHKVPLCKVFVSGPVGLDDEMALNKAVLKFELGVLESVRISSSVDSPWIVGLCAGQGFLVPTLT